jgi:DNA gyrase subunit A
MVKFNENDVRIMGRTASGVKGIELDDSTCIGAEIASEDDVVIIVTKKGYGKQTTVRDYRETKRGSKGVKALSITEKNGDIASFKIARPDTDIVIITDAGMVMRMPLDQISVLGRVTQGVRLINLKEEHTVATISLVDKEKEEEISAEEVVENSEVINNDNSDVVELAEREISESENLEISQSDEVVENSEN